MISLFHTFISEPFYNGFILLMDLLPFFDAGIIIVLFTIFIKILILPLSIKASKAQIEMKNSEKDIALIREQYKEDKQQIGIKTMEYYKEKGINPFASIFILIIQLPILIGLYHVFLRSGLPKINTDVLYSFVAAPAVGSVDMMFLGLVDIASKSLILALIAGITTYFQINLASASVGGNDVPGNDMAKAMTTQMKYVFPVVMTFIAYTISSAIALYLITSNLFAIGQEIYIRNKYHKRALVV